MGVLYRLASTDNPGISRVFMESLDTLPMGYYIGWHPQIVQGIWGIRGYSARHPWIIQGCPEYLGNLWTLCQGGGGGALYRLASTDNPGISGVSGESMKGHQTTDSVLGQPCNSHNSDDHYHPALV